MKRMVFIVTILLLMILPQQLLAGGLYLNEFATPSMGTAGAGSAAWANDASTAFHNAAGMTRLSGDQIMAGAGFFYSETKFNPSSDTPNDGGGGRDAGGVAPYGTAFYTHSISDDLKFGFNIGSVSAAALDYSNSWTGRYQCQEVDILTMGFNPAIAYRINEHFSVGAGFGLFYGDLTIDVAIPSILPDRPDGKAKIDGDDWETTFDLSVMYEITEQTRVGVTYWYGVDYSFSGDLKIDPIDAKVGSDTDLTLPQIIKASFYHQFDDKIAFVGSFGWEEWSKLDTVNVSVSKGTAKLPKNWDDTWHYSGGVHYRISDPWLLQFGMAYDTSPVSSGDRTADMPIDRQIRYAVGALYTYSEKLTFGGALEYLDYGDATINSDNLIGDYNQNHLIVTGFNVNYKF
jgi:long-chain fatty acid transport protein